MSYMHQAEHRLWFLHKGLKSDLYWFRKKTSAVNRYTRKELLVGPACAWQVSGTISSLC